MKYFYSLFTFIFLNQLISQQLYCDFEGTNVVSFAYSTGMLDTSAVNPSANAANNSAFCAKYIRDTSAYDNIKIVTDTKMSDIASTYASNNWTVSKMKMKVYTTAPPGTYIYIQLGSKNNDGYPSGIHSEYITATTKQNAWETLTFHFMQTPPGSSVSSSDCDKVIILFNPGSNMKDTFYFDDLLGPQLTTVGISQPDVLPFKLFQNNPNPARDNTSINFQLASNSSVSVKLYDVLGNPVYTVVDQQMKAGMHSVQVDLRNLPGGIYFYIFKADGITRTRKMIVDK